MIIRLTRMLAGLRALFTKTHADRDLDNELQHFRMRAAPRTSSRCGPMFDRLVRPEQFVVRPRAFPIDLFRRGAEPVEDVLDERERDLSFS